jgi:phosphoglycolate phosphatase
MGPSAFLFDLDGTLADTLPDIAASTNHVRAQFDLPPLPAAAVRMFVGDGARTLLQRALQPLLVDLPAAAQYQKLDDAFAAYVRHHGNQCTRELQLYPGVCEHLLTLRAAGHRLAVVTNKPERFALPIIAHLGLGDLLPVVIGGDTLPQKKPHPAPLLCALQRLGASPASATMVGDGLPDLRAGAAAGVRTIACLYGYGDPEALRQHGADGFWRAFGIAAAAPAG